MGRKAQIERIREAELWVWNSRARCQMIGQHPLQVIWRNRARIVLGSGIVLGVISARPGTRRALSALISGVLAIIRMQPQVLQFFKEQ